MQQKAPPWPTCSAFAPSNKKEANNGLDYESLSDKISHLRDNDRDCKEGQAQNDWEATNTHPALLWLNTFSIKRIYERVGFFFKKKTQVLLPQNNTHVS